MCISRFTSLLDGVWSGLLSDPEFVKIIFNDLESGQHRNPTGNPRYFTSAYFHNPEEFGHEISGQGFRLEKLIGVEGPSWLMPNFEDVWNNPKRRETLMELLRKTEEERTFIGVSLHIMAIDRKPF